MSGSSTAALTAKTFQIDDVPEMSISRSDDGVQQKIDWWAKYESPIEVTVILVCYSQEK